MKLIRRIQILILLTVIPRLAMAEPLKVVATLPTFASLAKTVAGENVEVSSVASAKFNPHFIEPRPSDVLRLKKCDLFIHGGLDLEAWRGPLVDAAGRPDLRVGGDRQLDLSTKVPLLEVPDHNISRAEGDIHLFGNPHYWLSPENGRIIAGEIADKLSELDPQNAKLYQSNFQVFSSQLTEKERIWKKELAPFSGAQLVGYHNEWIYFTKYFGLEMDKFLEPKPGIPPTPQQLEELTEYVKANRVRAIAQATFYSKEAGEQLAKRTGANFVLLCQGVGELEEASDYFSFIDYNVNQLVKALSGNRAD